jgi:predicted O-methyltransferase YrrM
MSISVQADAIAGELRGFECKYDDAVGGMKSQLAGVSNKLTSIASTVEQNALFQRFNRVLAPEHIEVLQTVWSSRLGVSTTKASLAYMAHLIRTTEQNSVGRLATQIEDAVLRTLVSSAVQSNTLDVLEIGTLFGIGLAMLYEHNHARYDNVHVTAIDPLDGYYGERTPDRLLNIPVSKATFWRNMNVLGVPREDITLIEHLSTSDQAIAAAETKHYDVLVIDGDHSYAGVKADFENYLGMMRPGGFIIFDDYNTSDWPDVKRFVDDEVKGRDDLAFIGAEWRTAIFQMSKRPTDEKT